MDDVCEIRRLMDMAEPLLPHHFEVIERLGDGTAIPQEALSEDHSVGIYGSTIPLKMRENLEGYREIEVADLLPRQTCEAGPTGLRVEWWLECVELRGVRFRTERLQYLDEGWWATTAEVVYPTLTVLALLRAIKQLYGSAQLCVNSQIPMPLWIRPDRLGADSRGAQAVVQARGEGRFLPTNIHTECPMDYARQWAQAARGYYRLANE